MRLSGNDVGPPLYIWTKLDKGYYLSLSLGQMYQTQKATVELKLMLKPSLTSAGGGKQLTRGRRNNRDPCR